MLDARVVVNKVAAAATKAANAEFKKLKKRNCELSKRERKRKKKKARFKKALKIARINYNSYEKHHETAVANRKGNK